MPESIPNLYDVSVLATDFAPDACQADTLRSMMAPHREMLQDLDSKIQALENELDGLRAQRKSLRARLDANEGLFAPIRKLAPELLGEIFSRTAAACTRWGAIVENLPPLIFLEVCRRWKRVAIGTPQLWSTIRLEEDSDEFRTVQLWITSSGSLPLDIHLNFPDYNFDADDIGSSKVVQLVAENLSRCRTLGTNGVHVLQALFPAENHTELRSLRSLQIDLSDYLRRTPPMPGEINAPFLQSLSIDRPGRLLKTLKFTGPLNNLSTVDISGWQPDPTQAQFLELCPALRILNVRFYSLPKRTSPSSAPAVLLPSLAEMNVAWKSNIDPTPFLRVIRSPSLKTLGLEQTDRDGPPSFTPNILFSFPSAPEALTCMRFVNSIPSSQKFFRWLLRKFPNIDTAVLEDNAAFAMIMDTLKPSPTLHPDEWACPNLRRLNLARLELSGDLLIRFIEARSPSNVWHQGDGQFLTNIVIEDCWVRTRNEQEILQALGRARGTVEIEGLETLTWGRPEPDTSSVASSTE